MKFSSVCIASMAHVLPEDYMTSNQIEEDLAPIYQKLKLRTGRLELMTGIKERRFWPKNKEYSPGSVALLAAKKALDTANISAKKVQMLVHASVCRDFLEPATASKVHHGLGLSPTCSFMDVSNACLGVLSSIFLMAKMIEMGTMKLGMVVAGESSGPLLESTIKKILEDKTCQTRKSLKKYISNFTIGSGAFAIVLGNVADFPNAPRILGGTELTDSSTYELCQGSGSMEEGLEMETDSETLLLKGLGLAKKNWSQLKDLLLWENGDPHHIITHQVGSAHHRGLYDALNLDNKKDFSTYEQLGNMGSVSLPITFNMAKGIRDFKRGEKIALLGIGSGLASLMMGVQW